MLELTLSTAHLPGTNVKGEVAGGNWLFLLPSLGLENVLYIGRPPRGALATLLRLGRRVLLADDVQTTLPQADREIDLIVIAGSARRLCENAPLRAELRRVLKPTGVAYLELGRWLGKRRDDRLLRALAASFGSVRRFWLTPLVGRRTGAAVPWDDLRTTAYFVRHGLEAPWEGPRGIRWIQRFLARRRLFVPCPRRCGVLAAGTKSDLSAAPPEYLRIVARQCGVDLDRYRWGLSAPGEYTSKKVLFYLFDGAGARPRYIAKLTRDSALNYRLENEHRALAWLGERGIGDAQSIPRVAFFGRHAGLAILGETVIEGVPLRQRAQADPHDPWIRAAVDWLTALGAATADRAAASPAEVSDALDVLLDRFVEIYRPPAGQISFLAGQIAAIRRSTARFPLVFQHGDAGPWNMLVTPGGRIAVLDWEAAEPQGMPLWDLFYFLRSHCLAVARRAGTSDRLQALARYFCLDGPMGPLLDGAIRGYCRRVGLSRELVEPLFHTCFMHRALKEASRLPADRLADGHYARLVALCIERRNSPSLGRMFPDDLKCHEPLPEATLRC